MAKLKPGDLYIPLQDFIETGEIIPGMKISSFHEDQGNDRR